MCGARCPNRPESLVSGTRMDAYRAVAIRTPGDHVNPMARPVHTYSIVARDPVTGCLGAAVQSHWFNVGPLVLWGEAGAGVVATQSFVEPAYGPRGLALMAARTPAPDALARLVEADPESPVRQVAFVDAAGWAAAHTGAGCVADAGHEVGDGFSVQANMMASPDVWPAMAEAYRAGLTDSALDLADRLVAALRAAERVGGDFRGKQSAAILVLRAEPSGEPWHDRLVDLRVEDHPEPVEEIARLLDLQRAYDLMNAGDAAVAAGDWSCALADYAAGADRAPQIAELGFWHAVALVHAGRLEDALPRFRNVFARDPRWRDAVSRLVAAGQLPADAATTARVTGV